MAAGEQLKRLGFAAVAIPVALGLVWYGGWPLALLLSAAAVLATRELFVFAQMQQIRPLARTAMVSGALLPLLTYAGIGYLPTLSYDLPFWCVAWLLLVLIILLARRHPDERPLASIAITIFAVLYTAVLPSFLIGIRHLAHPTRDWGGTWLVFTPLVATWVGDTAAMFGGKWIGGSKLAPRVSPGKTRSGSVFGFVGAVAATFAMDVVFLQPNGVALAPWKLALFGVVISIVGQVGDLVESLFKREVGVKDSSALIPGHGGVLDRLDSLYFAIPAAAVLYRWFGVL